MFMAGSRIKALIKRLLKQSKSRRAIILVSYDKDRTFTSLGILSLIADLSSVDEKILVCNNSRDDSFTYGSAAHGWKVIIGSNTSHEFSGWNEGLGALSANHSDYKWVLFANDTISRGDSYCRQSGLISAFARGISSKPKADVVGLVHAPLEQHRGMELYEEKVEYWVCTCCFIITRYALQSLNFTIDSDTHLSSLIGQDPSAEIISSNANDKLRRHIESWLTSKTNGWNAAIPPPHSNNELNILRAKSLMILKELSFSARIKSKKLSIYDPTTSKFFR
jgi:hypothetical protein